MHRGTKHAFLDYGNFLRPAARLQSRGLGSGSELLAQTSWRAGNARALEPPLLVRASLRAPRPPRSAMEACDFRRDPIRKIAEKSRNRPDPRLTLHFSRISWKLQSLGRIRAMCSIACARPFRHGRAPSNCQREFSVKVKKDYERFKESSLMSAH